MAKSKGGWKTNGDEGKSRQATGSIGVLSGKIPRKKPAIAKSTTQPSRLKKGK